MEKQEVKSKWDDLARQLGAEVTPEVEKLVEASAPAPAETQSPEIESRVDVSRAPAPKRPVAGWDSLANEFGLPTPLPTIEPVSDSTISAVQERVVEETGFEDAPESRRPRRDERLRRDDRPRREEKPRRDEHSRREGSARREEKPRRGDRGRRGEKPPREHNRDRHEESGRRDSPRRDERHDEPIAQSAPVEVEEPRFEETQAAPPPPVADERTSLGAAVSLWHKIFGSPVEQAAKRSDAPSIDEERYGTSRQVDDLEQVRETEFREHASMPVADVDERQEQEEREDVSGVSDDSDDSDDPAAADRKRRRRRGRRRRGGRDDRPEKEVGEHRRRRSVGAHGDRESDDQIDELATGDDGLDLEDSSDDNITDEGSVDANGESIGGSSRSRSALQRSIPSWDEAIGFIVESNMQSRSQRRQSSHTGARPQSPRGRGRGRQKK